LRHFLLVQTLIFLLVACSQPEAATAVPTQSIAETAVPTIAPTETQPPPTAEPEQTPTLSPVTPTSPVQPAPAAGPAPCGVILPILAESDVEVTAELPDVDDLPESVPEFAIPALERLLAAPETVGLAAYEIGFEANGVYHNADVPMPLASVVKIINLIAYAEEAGSGNLNPGQWIPLSEMDRYYLPGTDLSSHWLGLQDLEERNLVALDPPATPLEEIPWLMMRFSSNAATVYLHMTVGQEKIEETAVALGIASQTAPCPFIGQFLAMSNHDRPGSDQRAIEGYISDPDFYGEEVIRLTELYAADETFREEEIVQRGRVPSTTTNYFVENLNAKGSPADYAALMHRIFDNGLSSGYVNILVRRNLEWPMIFETNQEIFTTIGYKNGSFPGILTTVYYAQRIEDGRRVIVALFYRDLPDSMYRDWRRNLPHDEFARWLLADPEAISLLNRVIGN
jgi:D-alanyl-D-alanine carboxypeptidase